MAAQSTTPAPGARAPGSACEALNVKVNEGEGWVQIAGSRWSIVATKQYLGKGVCWPLATTKQAQPDTRCPSPQLPGHQLGGADHLHQITNAQHSHTMANCSIFGMHQDNLFRLPYRAKGIGNEKRARPGKGGGAPLAIEQAPLPPIAPPPLNA